MPEVQVTRAEFKRRWANFKEGVATDFVAALQARAPVDTARLRNSIKFKVVGNEIIISMVGYAVYVEFGTPPHLIRPKNAKALHWKSGKKDVFAKVVHHPGTRPNPFIRTTLRLDLPKIIKKNIYQHIG